MPPATKQAPVATNKNGGPATGTHRQTEKIAYSAKTVGTSHVDTDCELSLKVPGSSALDMRATVTSPNGDTDDAELLDVNDSTYKVCFVPTEVGVHIVSVKHKGLHTPGSPFQFTVGPMKDTGTHRVRAGGLGLEKGEAGESSEFNIWTREAGAGEVSVAVEGPGKAALNYRDNNNGSGNVTFKVNTPGDYEVSIKFNDQHIPDSPFKVKVAPALGEAAKIDIGPIQENLPTSKPVAFTVNTHGLKGKLTASVINPAGKEEECPVTGVDDTSFAVRFMPYDAGVYYANVKYNGAHIRGSPLRVRVGKEEADPAAVFAYGKGLEGTSVGAKTDFVVNTTKAGAGTLAVAVEGPSKVGVECAEVDEGYKIAYTPLAPGDYFVAVKYNGRHLAGSPFRVTSTGTALKGAAESGLKRQNSVVVETVTKTECTAKVQNMTHKISTLISNSSKVLAEGIGIRKAFQNKQNAFTCQTIEAGSNLLWVGVYGQGKPAEEIHIKHVGGKFDTYQCSYLVREKGEYLVVVKYGEDHIPGSPFLITCT